MREVTVTEMADWIAFQAAAPELAAMGQRRLERRVAYLATVRSNGAPRLHPVSPFFGGKRLLVYMEPASPKAADLRRDARYALHCGVEDDSGGNGEFSLIGRAAEVTDEAGRRQAFEAARDAGYRPVDRHVVFALGLGRVMATTYENGPQRRHWPLRD